MYQIKKGYTPAGTGMPELCRVIAYMPDGKTVNMYERKGGQLLPIGKLNQEKWQRIELPEIEKALCDKLSAKEVHILETIAVRNTTGAITL